MKLLKSKILWLSLILIGSLIFFFNYGTPWDLYKYNKEFKDYLKDKYQRDFIISDISYDLMHNTYHAQAYEQNQPEIQFYVGQNMGSKEITDSYDFENLRIEAKEEITAIVEEYLPEYTKVNVEVISAEKKELEVNIRVNDAVDDDLQKTIKKEIESREYTINQIFFNIK